MVVANALAISVRDLLARFLHSRGKGRITDALGLGLKAPRARGDASALESALARNGLFSPAMANCLDPKTFHGNGYTVTTCRYRGDLLAMLTDAAGAVIPGEAMLRQREGTTAPDRDQVDGLMVFGNVHAGPATLAVECPPRVIRKFDITVPEVRLDPRLRRYIEEGGRAFFMPIVSLCQGHVFGYEALARGFEEDVFPAELFAEAECKGEEVVVDLDMACIRSALRLAADAPWAAGRRIFINVSHPTLTHQDFRELCFDQAPAMSPSRVVFEIKENVPKDQIETIQACLLPLFLRGYQFAIDDQGAQGTCGRMLLNARTAYVKADVQFVNDCLRWGKYETLRGYLMEAADVGGRVVIEGVEEDWGVRDLAQFFELGVPYAQGFMFGKAKPPQAVQTEIPDDARRLLEQLWETSEFAGKLARAS